MGKGYLLGHLYLLRSHSFGRCMSAEVFGFPVQYWIFRGEGSPLLGGGVVPVPVSDLPAGVMGQTQCCLAISTPEPLGAERLTQAPPKPKAK